MLGLAALGLAYGRSVRPARRPAGASLTVADGAAFAAGLLALFLALVSPLDLLADHYLFSAHMVQHLLLTLVAPPLLLLGAPTWLLRPLLRWRVLAWAERSLGHPLVALGLFTVALAAWHVPRLYEWALATQLAHVAMHLSLLATATLFWWPVVHADVATHGLSYPGRMAYLFAACVPSTALGAVLTFAAAPFYPTYSAAADPLGLGLFALTRGAWGLTPLADQQLGGLLMWVPGGLVYLLGIGITLMRWLAAAPDDEEPHAWPASGEAR